MRVVSDNYLFFVVVAFIQVIMSFVHDIMNFIYQIPCLLKAFSEWHKMYG